MQRGQKNGAAHNFGAKKCISPQEVAGEEDSLPKLEEMVEWLAWLCSVPEGLGEDSSSVSSLSKGTSSLLPPSTGSESSSDEPEMEMCRHGCGPASSGCATPSSTEGLPSGSVRSLPPPGREGGWEEGGRGEKQLQHRPAPAGSAGPGSVLPIGALEAGHGGDAEDPGRADGDAGLHRGLLADAQQADLPHVAVAVANPNFVRALRAAVAGRSAGELRGCRRLGLLGTDAGAVSTW